MVQLTHAFDRPVGIARQDARRLTAALIIGLSLLLVLTFSQAWLKLVVGPDADPAKSGLIQAIYLPAYAASLALIALAPLESTAAIALNPVLLLLVGLTLASTTWSIDPSISFRRFVALAFTTGAGVALGANLGWRQLSALLATAFGLLAIGSAAAAIAAPSFGRMHEIFPGAWSGLFQEKNALGGFMASGFAFALAATALDAKRWVIWTGLAALCLALVAATASKTALVAAALGAAAYSFVWWVRRGPAFAVLGVWIVLGLLLAAGLLIWRNPSLPIELLGKDPTLSGRTKLWAAETRAFAAHEWLGYGYGAVWSDQDRWGPLAKLSREAGFTARHAHSSWKEAQLGLGWLGLATWSALALQAVVLALVTLCRSPGAYVVLPFLAAYFFTGLTESNAFNYNDLNWVIFVALLSRMVLGDRQRA